MLGVDVMSAIRIIPCLDVHEGRVVKGINFENLRDAGDPVELGAYYEREGADELVFLDISASVQGRKTMVEVARKTAQAVTIPFIVGGGMSTIDDIASVLEAGADKISINSAAVNYPSLITEAVKKFGSHRLIVAIDAIKKGPDNWEVVINGGQKATGLDAVAWAKEVEKLGAGEILVTSMDKDGTKDGYDIELTAAISDMVNIPVIASGGAGKLEHLYDAVKDGKADAVLCASIFHFREYTIKQAKQYLADKGVTVRL